jgi:hypothetical protein
LKAKVVQAADEAADVRAEGQGVAEKQPLHPDQGHEHIIQGQGGQDIFPPGHASVKEGQGRGHHQDQGAACQDPGGVAGVDGGVHLEIPLNPIPFT